MGDQEGLVHVGDHFQEALDGDGEGQRVGGHIRAGRDIKHAQHGTPLIAPLRSGLARIEEQPEPIGAMTPSGSGVS